MFAEIEFTHDACCAFYTLLVFLRVLHIFMQIAFAIIIVEKPFGKILTSFQSHH